METRLYCITEGNHHQSVIWRPRCVAYVVRCSSWDRRNWTRRCSLTLFRFMEGKWQMANFEQNGPQCWNTSGTVLTCSIAENARRRAQSSLASVARNSSRRLASAVMSCSRRIRLSVKNPIVVRPYKSPFREFILEPSKYWCTAILFAYKKSFTEQNLRLVCYAATFSL